MFVNLMIVHAWKILGKVEQEVQISGPKLQIVMVHQGNANFLRSS